jgi:uncharacterized protein YneF (UPF0154 family)
MKITIVGLLLVLGGVIVGVFIVRALNQQNSGGNNEGGPDSSPNEPAQ